MPKLEPLQQFICDTCHEIIQSPKEGWLEWIHDGKPRQAHSFRICHHKTASLLEGSEGCYRHGGKSGRSDSHLDYVLDNRMAQVLSFVDPGPYHEPSFSGPGVSDLREWVELVRRLSIPFYEEARLYFSEAEAEGDFQDANEILIYSEVFLRQLIKNYAEK
jgi:hypothetical protein